MKTLSALLAIILFFTFLSCSKSNDTTTPTTPTATINILDGMTYSPSTQTVAKGTIVYWKNTASVAHTATDAGVFDTGTLSPGSTSAGYTANTAGTFPYHCLIHGTTMAGTLIVNP